MYTHGKLAKPHSCPHCPYTSTTKANIRKHVIGRHEDPERRDFPCNKVGEFLTNLTNFSLQCPKKFKTSSNLVEHMKVHEPGYRYTCQVGLDQNDGQFFRAMEWLMFFLGHHPRQWFFNGFDKVGPSPLNVFLGVQPLESMVFRWFSKF